MGSVAPWSETPLRVIIEFKKGTDGCKRKVYLTHNRQQIPQQLYGRVDPKAWDALVSDCERLATEHPHVAKMTCDCCCQNLAAACSFLVIGFGCFQADSGDYDLWLQKVNQVIAKHQPYFAQCGCTLSLQSVHGSFWVQIDIAPAMVAMGQPAMMAPPMQYGKPGY